MSDDQIEHHREIEYVEIQVSPQGTFMIEPLPDGCGCAVQGICPACGGQTRMTIPRGLAVGHKGPWRRRQVASEPQEALVVCMCGHVHENRPPEATDHGCGRFWSVPLP